MQIKMRKVLLLALISLTALAGVVVAAELGVFYSGEIVVTDIVEGYVKVSETNSTMGDWVHSLNLSSGDDWYARFETETGGYIGNVTITWVLQEKINSTWTDTNNTVTTLFTLNGGSQIIYASTNGLIDTNENWGAHTTASTWRLEVTFES